MAKEFYFWWTCPTCGCKQQEAFNLDQGPYLSLTCEQCSKAFDEIDLPTEAANAWADCIDKAERDYLGDDFIEFCNSKDYTKGDVLADRELENDLRKAFERSKSV
jgi:hypothetical protein